MIQWFFELLELLEYIYDQHITSSTEGMYISYPFPFEVGRENIR